MGVDIHMYIVKDNAIVEKDIFDGRNSEWFDNLQGRGWDSAYNEFPCYDGISPESPKDFIDKFYEQGYYGFYYINVKDFKEWFEKYRPDLEAGWVSTYEKWMWDKKHIVPEEPRHFLSKDDIIEDMHFIEYKKEYDCSSWLYNHLVYYRIDDNADITYWFDC